MSQEHTDGNIPPFPAKGSNTTAFDYFNNQYFFQGEVSLYFLLQSDKSKLRRLTFHEFFKENQIKAGQLIEVLADLGCDRSRLIKVLDKWEKDNFYKERRRMVNVGFKVRDTKLSHTNDVVCFSEQIEELFQWWDEPKQGNKYLGPYLFLVQSSGTGKLKLMYEYKKAKAKESQEAKGRNEDRVAARLLLLDSHAFENPQEERVFDGVVYLLGCVHKVLDRYPRPANAAQQAARAVFCKLDQTLFEIGKKDKSCKKVVLMFTGSNSLRTTYFGDEAFLFRCVCLWLREDRGDLRVVAVFSGCRLANFAAGSDTECNSMMVPPNELRRYVGYHAQGWKLNPIFWNLTTIGSCLHLWDENDYPDSTGSEYHRSVYYGRPLFAVMAKARILDWCIPTVLTRMFLSENFWYEKQDILISFLATRIQLGQASTAVVLKLVSYGYANFSGHFGESRTAQLSYLTDPVCARLAMCMMDEDFECMQPIQGSAHASVKGMGKRWWTEKLMEIFSSGIVHPDTASFGRVVAALYMLFCGDLLRKVINDHRAKGDVDDSRDVTQKAYIHFSVSLDEWLYSLQSGGKLPRKKSEGETLEDVPKVATLEGGNTCNVTVGFIQVCRNYLRSYGDSWRSLGNGRFLKMLYESGTAFYTFPGCPLLDLVIPLRVNTSKEPEIEFVPMLVSIHDQSPFSHDEVETVCAKLTQKATTDGLTKALCLVLVFGCDSVSKSASPEFELVSKELMNSVVSKVIFIPCDDDFGLSKAVKARKPTAVVKNAIFVSHPYLRAHGVELDSSEASHAAVYDK